jgi:hypothetical protein
MIWGKIEDKVGGPFKVIHTELEFDKNNLQDKELISYKEYLDMTFKTKTEEEEENAEYRELVNQEVTYDNL